MFRSMADCTSLVFISVAHSVLVFVVFLGRVCWHFGWEFSCAIVRVFTQTSLGHFRDGGCGALVEVFVKPGSSKSAEARFLPVAFASVNVRSVEGFCPDDFQTRLGRNRQLNSAMVSCLECVVCYICVQQFVVEGVLLIHGGIQPHLQHWHAPWRCSGELSRGKVWNRALAPRC